MKKLKKLKIEVTQDDITHGRKDDGASCPIARACRRLGFIPNAMPGHMSLMCSETHEYWQAVTPSVASVFMGNFDSGLPVQPFTFEIQAVNLIDSPDLSTEDVEAATKEAQNED